LVQTDAEGRKCGERTGLDTLLSPRRKRCGLDIVQFIELGSVVEKSISLLLGKYIRKYET